MLMTPFTRSIALVNSALEVKTASLALGSVNSSPSLTALEVIAVSIFQRVVSHDSNLTTLSSVNQLYNCTGQRGIPEVGVVQQRKSEDFAYLGRRGGSSLHEMLGSKASEANHKA